ncbi:MAG: hypothetical protein ACRDG3_09415 [Tepidiformaceae bacterium]
MTTPARTATHTVTAFLDGEDSPDILNPIHSTAVAQAYGFKGALVGGVTVYGWMVPSILDALGDAWLDSGWVDVRFRRPVYAGDVMTTTVSGSDGGISELAMTNQDGDVCLAGTLGVRPAPWLEELHTPRRLAAEPRPPTLPRLTADDAPVGRDLRPLGIEMTADLAGIYVRDKQRDDSPRWTGSSAHIHPGWIAAQMTPLLHHSYDYGPSIHTRSQIQQIAAARPGQRVTFAGTFVETFERKGHHYGVIDGLMLAEDGAELARLRHTTIYQLAAPGSVGRPVQ